jgi:hypothetical protein
MTVPCPMPEWPSGLLEVGPPEIVPFCLRGEVAIGPATFRLTAVRIDPIRFGPDFRSDQDLHIYSEYDLLQMLDVISAIVDVSEQSVLQLRTGRYILWMLPSSA